MPRDRSAGEGACKWKGQEDAGVGGGGELALRTP